MFSIVLLIVYFIVVQYQIKYYDTYKCRIILKIYKIIYLL